jgi:hypothetical protein
VAEGTGRLVGRVVNVLIKRSARETRDPWHLARLHALEQEQPLIRDNIPALTDSLIKDWDDKGSKVFNQGNQESAALELTVLVHGTMSSGMRMAAALFGNQPPRAGLAKVVRYEHDTFRTLTSNAEDLAQLIQRASNAYVAMDADSVGRSVAFFLFAIAAADWSQLRLLSF